MNARDQLLQLLRRGFRGTAAEAAFATGLAKVTAHVRLRSLESEGLAKVVATEITRGGKTNIWAATHDVGSASRCQAKTGVVAHALASRAPLECVWLRCEDGLQVEGPATRVTP